MWHCGQGEVQGTLCSAGCRAGPLRPGGLCQAGFLVSHRDGLQAVLWGFSTCGGEQQGVLSCSSFLEDFVLQPLLSWAELSGLAAGWILLLTSGVGLSL